MYLKSIFVLFIFFSPLYAEFQKVKVGHIDQFYSDKLSKDDLIYLIKEIEDTFQRDLGYDVFDYSKDGKTINILYIPDSKKKKDLQQNIHSLKMSKRQIDKTEEYLIDIKKKLITFQTKLDKSNQSLDNQINSLNRYIEESNNKKITSQEEFEKIKKYEMEQRNSIKRKRDIFNQNKINFDDSLNSYNQRVSLYSSQIEEYNNLQRKIENIASNMKEVKGVAKGYTQITMKTFRKNGKTYTKKIEKSFMQNIEIYGFESLEHLRAILAHELGHLVGLGHIEVEGALMHPILQGNQIQKLELTYDDVQIFNSEF